MLEPSTTSPPAMRAAGWKVKKQPFEFPFFQELAPRRSSARRRRRSTYTTDDFADDGLLGQRRRDRERSCRSTWSVPIGC